MTFGVSVIQLDDRRIAFGHIYEIKDPHHIKDADEEVECPFSAITSNCYALEEAKDEARLNYDHLHMNRNKRTVFFVLLDQ